MPTQNDRRLKVVVYAIAKNEEQFVKRWINSMREADEVVVLDTGSTDNTASLLRSLGAKVGTATFAPWETLAQYDAAIAAKKMPWRFDWARNASIGLALKFVPDADILVCTDLDEVLLPGWREKLETAWKDYERANGRPPTSAQYEYVWNFNPDGSDGCKFRYEKVHAPHAAKWIYPVHEVLDYSACEKCAVNVDGMRLEHHADPEKSRRQYLAMLELSVREHPDNDRTVHYLGREYFFRHRWADAMMTLRRHLALPSATWKAERAASMRYLAQCYGRRGNSAMKLLWLRMAMAEAPEQREAALDFAEEAYAQKDWYLVADACQRCLAVTARQLTYLTEPAAWGARPWDLYSVALWRLNRHEEAIEANDEALKFSPTDERLLKNAEIMKKLVDAHG